MPRRGSLQVRNGRVSQCTRFFAQAKLTARTSLNRIVREAAPHFRIKDPKKQENRSIINVSSTSGLHGNVGQANYAVAKAGVVGLTKTIAKEWVSTGVPLSCMVSS